MKYIAIILLVALAVYLYKRAQRLAEEERQQDLKTPVEKEILDNSLAEEVQDEGHAFSEDATEAKKVEDAEMKEVSSPADEGSIFETKEAPMVLAEVVKSEPEADTPAELLQEPELAVEDTPVAAVDESWVNAKLSQAMSDYRSSTGKAVKHQALLGAIAECYKQRKQSEYCVYGTGLTTEYLSVFAELESPSSEKGVGFMSLSTLLNDSGQFDSAIEVCQKAIEYGVLDGTVTGFEGRITRIEKAKAKAAK